MCEWTGPEMPSGGTEVGILCSFLSAAVQHIVLLLALQGEGVYLRRGSYLGSD